MSASPSLYNVPPPIHQCLLSSPIVMGVAVVVLEAIRANRHGGGGIPSQPPLLVENHPRSLDALLQQQQEEQDDEYSHYTVSTSSLDTVTLLRGGGGCSPDPSYHTSRHELAFAVHLPLHLFHHHSHTLYNDETKILVSPLCPKESAKLRLALHGDHNLQDEYSSVAVSKDTSSKSKTQRQRGPRRYFSWLKRRRRPKKTRLQRKHEDITIDTETSSDQDCLDNAVPLRFVRAAKGNPTLAKQRYLNTLNWRKQYKMDTILQESFPKFEFIKQHYPHYFHLRGRKNEPVYFEMPPRTNLQALRKGGVTLEMLLRHYAMVTEFTWQYVEGEDDLQQSIYILDLEGIRLSDFVGECVEFTRKACAFCNQHYPERSGCILVINVPSYFKVIWKVIKRFADKKTLGKVRILRGKDEILETLLEFIPLENIPPEYGGTSMPLGEAPEEELLWNLMRHNNHVALYGTEACGGKEGNCPFCSFEPARRY